MWELCLDREVVPIWGQPVLQAGALLGNSPLAGEAAWTQLKEAFQMEMVHLETNKCINKLRELEIAEKGLRLREESLRISAMLFVLVCNVGCSA